MSDDTDDTQLPGPLAEPTHRNADHLSMTASWPVGTPDEDGWQRTARLVCRRYPGKGYRAWLTTVDLRGNEESFTSDTPIIDIPIDQKQRPLFERSQLEQHTHDALATLRQRFEAGDTHITALFNPDEPDLSDFPPF
ncbi:hypothetical protein [Nocardia wallacei]|uniref:hypothetical protein n=1 Tax=Nocardia wallacei TaxID=480035 RepID=UPI00245721CF|nr:hypothetical protein [Nocardia wallacei]